ncbi:hypothetical protein WN51_03756 [Melipona quadrifasciata]|uniref:Uncharacterized protein n=1 Tax=Melipona quadrifasciata TaxID=166423 RepID=A0A0N0BEA8_9HYME|nr:hypothetical protein WN51_03756 [Melipona quadrifasciata]
MKSRIALGMLANCSKTNKMRGGANTEKQQRDTRNDDAVHIAGHQVIPLRVSAMPPLLDYTTCNITPTIATFTCG